MVYQHISSFFLLIKGEQRKIWRDLDFQQTAAVPSLKQSEDHAIILMDLQSSILYKGLGRLTTSWTLPF